MILFLIFEFVFSDLKVKNLLVYAATQFSEWLMQKGLLRLEQRCETHQNSCKLAKYSDASKQPFSGGFLWISDCCPDSPVSVYQGSIFEASVYPPGVLFKLIYHWACQTNANNVISWVKVGICCLLFYLSLSTFEIYTIYECIYLIIMTAWFKY